MEQKHLDQSTLSDPGRRRFARGGLAAPVVLGTLASKPILGHAGGLQCSMSGQMSGNTSVQGNEPACSQRGANTATWLAASTWPTPIDKGVLKVNKPEEQAKSGTVFNNANLSSSSTGSVSAIFSSTSSLSSTSYVLGSAFTTADGLSPATMLQVLMNVTSNPANAMLGVATVTSLLNALSRPATYPVSAAQVVAMFNAVSNGGTYMVGGVTPWDRARVVKFMQSLYMS